MKVLIFDIEILKAIPPRDGQLIPGIEYAKGFNDHANLGITCIGIYDYHSDRYMVFGQESLTEFQALVDESNLCVGFNNIAFDNKVLACNGVILPDCNGVIVPEAKSYDLLREIWIAAGLSPTWGGGSHAGYGLDAVCEANFGLGKTGNGALAPVQWQRGEYCRVISYCLNDIFLSRLLFDRARAGLPIKDPKTGGWLELRRPVEAL